MFGFCGRYVNLSCIGMGVAEYMHEAIQILEIIYGTAFPFEYKPLHIDKEKIQSKLEAW